MTARLSVGDTVKNHAFIPPEHAATHQHTPLQGRSPGNTFAGCPTPPRSVILPFEAGERFWSLWGVIAAGANDEGSSLGKH